MKEVLDLGDANLMEQDFYVEVKQILNSAREKVYKTANFAMVEAYWNIGKCIVEKQGGKIRQNTERNSSRIFLLEW